MTRDFIFLLISISILLISCETQYGYINNIHSTPILEEKHEFEVSGYIGLNHSAFATSFTATDHIGFFVNGFRGTSNKNPNTNNRDIYYLEGGMGFYNNKKLIIQEKENKIVLGLFGGYGYGKVDSKFYTIDFTSYSDEYYLLNCNYQKAFMINGFYGFSTKNPSTDSKGIYFGEGGFGYYNSWKMSEWNLNFRLFTEVFGGYGFGKINSKFNYYTGSEEIEYSLVDCQYHRAFIQPVIGVILDKYISYGIFFRSTYSNYNKYNYESYYITAVDKYSTNYSLKYVDGFTLEPLFFVNGGTNWIRLNLQLGYTDFIFSFPEGTK